MKAVPIHDAKTNLSKYIAAAKRGETVFIGARGEAEVMLCKATRNATQLKRTRSFAAAKGKIRTMPDAFSEAADQDVANLLLGN